MKTYEDRVIRHSLMWVNGLSKHNHIDDECVIDFSCCCPHCFTKDLEQRMKSHTLLIEKLRKTDE